MSESREQKTATAISADEFQLAINRLKKRQYTPKLAPHDLTPLETHVLISVGNLIDCCGVARPQEIGRVLNLSPSALSQRLGSLEQKGYITRTRSDDDARKIAVALTQTGREFVDDAMKGLQAMMDDLRKYLGNDDLREFMRILDRVDSFFQEQLDAGKLEAHPCYGPSTHASLPYDIGA